KTTHWRSDVIVDCGIPLNFSFGSEWDWMHTVVQFDPREAEPGRFIAGLTRLHSSIGIGLHQPVNGVVSRMDALGLHPEDENFGRVHEVSYWYKLRVNDDELIHEPFIFMTLEVTDVEAMVYRRMPMRLPEYPKPDVVGVEGQP